MKPALVSILMPARNGEAFIAQAIDSVLAQAHQNWELIVVDDGSSDGTAAVVSTYADGRIRTFFQESRGQASALNRGLDLAVGEYVTTLDVDDWYTPNSLHDRVRFLEEHGEIGAVYGDGYYCRFDGQPICLFSQNRVNGVSGDVYNQLIVSPFFGTGANIMIRRQVLEEHRIRYDESIVWGQDYDFYIRLAEQTLFGVIDALVVWYRLHETNLTMSTSADRRREDSIRTKSKVLVSSRFENVPAAAKARFFQVFLEELHGRLEEQAALFRHNQFQSLPACQQARLLRISANNYVTQGMVSTPVESWLRQAWALDPLNPKTTFVRLLAGLSPKVAQTLVKTWRSVRSIGGKPQAATALGRRV